jgi:hypothetical protein
MTTISKDKAYRTRDGREVRIYATNGGAYPLPVHGAITTSSFSGYIPWCWREDGKQGNFDHYSDLIEVKPRFRIERWVNVYPSGVDGCYETREAAMGWRSKNCLATKRIITEGTEGEDDEEGK